MESVNEDSVEFLALVGLFVNFDVFVCTFVKSVHRPLSIKFKVWLVLIGGSTAFFR